jgi:hypothetical protein
VGGASLRSLLLLLLRLLGLLLRLGLSGSLGGRSSGNSGLSGGLSSRLSSSLSSSLSSGSLDGSGSRGLSSRGLLSGLGLGGLSSFLLLLLAEEAAEDRRALTAGRAALGLLLLGLLLLLSLLLGLFLSRLGSGRLGRGGSLLSSGSGLSGSRLGRRGLLLLLDRSGLQALESLLVGLRLGDGSSELFGLSNLGLQLGNPVVTLSGAGSLEGVLVALGSEVELVGAINGRLRGIGLDLESAARSTDRWRSNDLQGGSRRWGQPCRPSRCRRRGPCQSRQPRK